MPRIGLTGASGKLGTKIARKLLEIVPPSDLVLISRNPAKLAEFAALGVETRAGDFDQPEGLPAAFAGLDRLLIISTLSVGRRYEQHQLAIDAAVKVGVGHLIYTSSGGISLENPAIVIRDHRLTEEALKRSGVPYTILRDSLYAEAVATEIAPRAAASGEWRSASGEGRVAFAAKDDCSAVMVKVLTENGHENQTYELTGPELLSMRDAAALLSEMSGKPVQYIPISDEEFDGMLAAIGVPWDYIEGMNTPGVGASSRHDILSYEQGIRGNHFAILSNDIEKVLGRKPLSLREVYLQNAELLGIPRG